MESSLKSSLSETGGDIYLRNGDQKSPLLAVALPSEVAGKREWSSKIRLEEGFGIWLSTDGEQRNVEGGNDGEDVDDHSEP